MPARRRLPGVHVRLRRRNRWFGWNRWLGRRLRGRWNRRKPRHLHLQLPALPAGSRLRGLQLCVQRRRDDDDDRSVGDRDCDGNWDGLQLGLGNRSGLRVPGLPGRNLVSALQLRLAASAVHRSVLGSHGRDQLRRGHGRLLRMGSARNRLHIDGPLSVGNLRTDERRLGWRFDGRRLWLRVRSLPRGTDLSAVQLQLLPADTDSNPRNDLHDGRRLPGRRCPVPALSRREDRRLSERYLRERDVRLQLRDLPVDRRSFNRRSSLLSGSAQDLRAGGRLTAS